MRDRAIVYLLFGTGLRRAEVVGLNSRTVFLARDARQALADYLNQERPATLPPVPPPAALFLSAASIAARRPDGRLSPRSINDIVGEVGRLHDAQMSDPERRLGVLLPHDARHTFAFQLSQASGHNRAERRLGHANDRYLRLYTNPPDDIAAGYIEDL
ncbi:tyrosine-type recombinase/integrase [Nonomuraea sp. NPDC003727]